MKPTAGDNFLTYFGVNAQSPRVGGKNQDVELDPPGLRFSFNHSRTV